MVEARVNQIDLLVFGSLRASCTDIEGTFCSLRRLKDIGRAAKHGWPYGTYGKLRIESFCEDARGCVQFMDF